MALAVGPVALAQHRTGPYSQVSTQQYSPAPFEQQSPVTAFDGTGSLVVWEDVRGDVRRGDLLAVRLAGDGRPLGAPFVISAEPWAERYPSVACRPLGACLITWTEFAPLRRVLARALSASGVLSAVTELDTDANGSVDYADVNATPAGFRVVWRRSGVHLISATFDATGTVSSARQEVLTAPAEIGAWRHAATAGQEQLLWWETPNYRTGQLVDGGVTAISTLGQVQYWPTSQLLVNGGAFLAVWCELNDGGQRTELRARHVNLDGGLREPAPTVLGTRSGIQTIFTSAATSDSTFLLTFIDDSYSNVWRSFSSNLVEVARGPVDSSSAQSLSLSAAPNPVVVREASSTGLTIATVDFSGDAGSVAALSGTTKQVLPRLVAGLDGGLLVWWDRVGREALLRATLVGTGGEPGAVQTVNELSMSVPREVDLAFDGRSYVVAWPNERNTAVSLRRLATDGRLLGPERDVGAVGFYSGVAATVMNETTTLVWSAALAMGDGLFLRRLGADGGWLDAAPRNLGRTRTGPFGAARLGGAPVFVLGRGTNSFTSDVTIERLEDDGGLSQLRTFQLEVARIAVASSDATLLLVWCEYLQPPYRIRAARFDAQGQPLDTPALTLGDTFVSSTDADPTQIAVAFDGTQFRALWEAIAPDGGADLRQSVIPERGAGVVTSAFVATAATEQSPALATLSPGRLAYAYATSVPGDALRVASGAIAEVPPGARCDESAECLQGACVVGRCEVDGGAGGGTAGGTGAGGGAAGGSNGGGSSAGGSSAGGASAGGSTAGGSSGGDIGGAGGDAQPGAFRVGCSCDSGPGSVLLFALSMLLASRRRAP